VIPGGGEPPAQSAYRIIDWTRLDSAPPPADVARLLNTFARDGARLAVLVSTPRVLRVATVFAEQAELLGAQVRVFIGATEAARWLYRDLPMGEITPDWPVGDPSVRVTPLRPESGQEQ
jgi:hypothetical protein